MSQQTVFTLKDEAHRTSHRSRLGKGADSKFRNHPVSFTTIGSIDPFECQRGQGTTHRGIEPQLSPQSIDDHLPPTHGPPNAEPRGKQDIIDAFQPPNSADRTHDLLSEASEGPSINEFPHVRRTAPSSPSSDSGDEVVLLFKGRGKSHLSKNETFSLRSIADEVLGLETSTVPWQEGGMQNDINSGRNTPMGMEVDGDAEGDMDYLANILATGEQLTVARFHFRDIGIDSQNIHLDDISTISETDILASNHQTRIYQPTNKPARHKRSSKTGLFSKYPVDMTITDIMHELRRFLSSSEQQ